MNSKSWSINRFKKKDEDAVKMISFTTVVTINMGCGRALCDSPALPSPSAGTGGGVSRVRYPAQIRWRTVCKGL